MEDEEIILADITRILKAEGYDVAGTAHTGHDALAEIPTHTFDLILLDIRLQGKMDGVALARKIRETNESPLVFITAHAATVRSTDLTGRYTAVTNPITPRQLKEVLELLLR